MKINPIMLLIALGVAALAGYGFFVANKGDANQLLVAITGGVTLFVTLSGLLAISSPNGGSGNIRALSALFVVLFVVANVVFSFFASVVAPCVIVNGILFLVYVAVAYAVTKALK